MILFQHSGLFLNYLTLTILPLPPLEPVGSVAPKVSLADEVNNARTLHHETISLACKVQAYPVPFYRFVIFSTFTLVPNIQVQLLYSLHCMYYLYYL